MKPFLASPNETIEAVSEIEIEKWPLSKETQTVQNEKRSCGAKKKLPVNVPDNPFTDARTT